MERIGVLLGVSFDQKFRTQADIKNIAAAAKKNLT
jgi:hypothetical protein